MGGDGVRFGCSMVILVVVKVVFLSVACYLEYSSVFLYQYFCRHCPSGFCRCLWIFFGY